MGRKAAEVTLDPKALKSLFAHIESKHRDGRSGWVDLIYRLQVERAYGLKSRPPRRVSSVARTWSRWVSGAHTPTFTMAAWCLLVAREQGLLSSLQEPAVRELAAFLLRHPSSRKGRQTFLEERRRVMRIANSLGKATYARESEWWIRELKFVALSAENLLEQFEERADLAFGDATLGPAMFPNMVHELICELLEGADWGPRECSVVFSDNELDEEEAVALAAKPLVPKRIGYKSRFGSDTLWAPLLRRMGDDIQRVLREAADCVERGQDSRRATLASRGRLYAPPTKEEREAVGWVFAAGT